MTDTHALARTSPKGGPFIGTCMKCGMEGLSTSDMRNQCLNPAALTQNETLLMAIKGPETPR